MLTIRSIADGRVMTVPPEQLAARLDDPSGVLWVDVVDPGPGVGAVLTTMGVDPWVAEDVAEPATHPKAEAHPDYLFLVVNGLDLDDEGGRFEISTIELDVVLGRRWLVTSAREPLEVSTVAAAALERDPAVAATPADVLHLVLDAMVDEYEPFIDRFIPDRVDAIENALFDGCADEAIRREIHLRRRDVLRLQRVTTPQAAAVQRLAGLAGDVAPGQRHLFEDIAGRLAYVAAQTESLRVQLDTAFDHYQSTVANAQNEVMKVLTMVSAILLPITVVAGVYGMNFRFMPELDEPWGYPVALAVMAAIVVVGLVVFRIKGWIGGHGRTRRVARTLQVGAGKVLRTPALGARIVGRAGMGVASSWRLPRS